MQRLIAGADTTDAAKTIHRKDMMLTRTPMRHLLAIAAHDTIDPQRFSAARLNATDGSIELLVVFRPSF